jgi:hypothetical protein
MVRAMLALTSVFHDATTGHDRSNIIVLATIKT